jgi:intracellular septation protein A
VQWQLLFVSIGPLVVYMLFWARGESRVGMAAAIAVAVVELFYNSIAIGRIEPVSCLSTVLFGACSLFAWRTRDDFYFKMQPALFEAILALVMIWYYLAFGVPLLAVFAKDYVGLQGALSAYQRGYATVYTTTLSRSLPYLMLLHAGLTGYGARARSTWWWFNVRVFGFYVSVVVLFLSERLLGVAP